MSDPQSWALVSVRLQSRETGRSAVFARKHQFGIGRAVTFDREDPEVSAMECVAGAVAADVADTFRRVARERRVVVDELEAVVRGELENPLVYLGVVGEKGSPSLRALTVKCYVGTGSPEGRVREAWEEALSRSPLVTTFRNCLDLRLELQIDR